MSTTISAFIYFATGNVCADFMLLVFSGVYTKEDIKGYLLFLLLYYYYF